jgi:site-specific recombinase XerD
MAPETTLAVAETSEENLARLVDRARDYAAAAKAPRTLKEYAADWARFATWSTAQGLTSLPAAPSVVAVYLAQLADNGLSVSAIQRALAAIAHHHRRENYEVPRSPAVTEVLKGIRRKRKVATSGKAPLLGKDLGSCVGHLGVDVIGLRDRALVTLGWLGAFRRSELVSLDVGDVRFTEEGIIVRLATSKTDQEGRGAEKGIPYAGNPAVCPVRALRAWLDAARLETGPLFRAVTRHGRIAEERLSDRAVALVVKRLAARAGLEPAAFAGHSLRAGFATTAAQKGKSLDAIMRQTGHKSERVARGYIRHATLFTDNAATGLL